MADQDGLLLRALQYEEGHPRRSGHILKVLALAGMIGREEGLSEEEQMILEAAAILHDIGIKHCKEKYGIASQELQKKEAPAIAKEFLNDCGYPASWVEKITRFIQVHHDYDHIDGMECQILVEADLWVSALEEEWTQEKIQERSKLFRTETGKVLFFNMIK